MQMQLDELLTTLHEAQELAGSSLDGPLDDDFSDVGTRTTLDH